jgi:flagellar biogenesis protein FliO
MLQLLQQSTGALGYAGFPADLGRTLLALGGTCILFWLVARWLSKRRFGPDARWDSAVRVLRRIPLDRRKHLYLVQVADRILLIGAGDHGPPSLIADLDPEALERASRAGVNDTYG